MVLGRVSIATVTNEFQNVSGLSHEQLAFPYISVEDEKTGLKSVYLPTSG